MAKQKDKKLRWVVEFSVDPTWVADGFDLTNERAHRMLANDLHYAFNHEIGAKILKAPKPELIEKLQSE